MKAVANVLLAFGLANAVLGATTTTSTSSSSDYITICDGTVVTSSTTSSSSSSTLTSTTSSSLTTTTTLSTTTTTSVVSGPTGFSLFVESGTGTIGKRQTLQYLSASSNLTTDVSQAAVYDVTSAGTLIEHNGIASISIMTAADNAIFALSDVLRDIRTTFALANGILTFTNAAFPNGAASFCATSQSVYIVNTAAPADCNPVALRVVTAPSEWPPCCSILRPLLILCAQLLRRLPPLPWQRLLLQLLPLPRLPSFLRTISQWY